MEKKELKIQYAFCQMDELSAEDRDLVLSAIEATRNSYAAYSHFHVGAAIRLDDGKIVIGANQENAAYPAGLCAERTAIFAAQAQQPEHAIKAIAIAAKNEHGLLDNPVTPCGICRQVMLEIEDRYQQPMRILLYGNDGVYVINTIRDLMPLSFISASLED